MGMKMADNTLRSVMDYFHLKLDGDFPPNEVESFFWILSESSTGITRLDFIKNPDIRYNESELLDFIRFVRRLKNHEPVQYIAGSTEFVGLRLKVTPDVLIPRPETEELVQWVVDVLDTEKPVEIMDVGTGSGCIALAVKKKRPNAFVKGVDISRAAIEVARGNAQHNNLEVDFLLMDALNLPYERDKYDVVVSNPPYVLESEKGLMQPNVLNHEPHTALFVEDYDPLLFYEAIGHWAHSSLTQGGQLFFETNEKYADDVSELMLELGFDTVETRNDFLDKPRFVRAVK